MTIYPAIPSIRKKPRMNGGVDLHTVEDIYLTYRNTVYRFSLSYTRNATDAEDVTQTVFLKYLKNKDKISSGKEKQWLLRVAYHECVELFRQMQHLSLEPVPETTFQDTVSSDLFHALQALRPEYRAVVHLFYYEGYSTKEIGKLMHVSQTCITTRLSRARDILKAELEGLKK